MPKYISDAVEIGLMLLILCGIVTIVYLFADNFWRILSGL